MGVIGNSGSDKGITYGFYIKLGGVIKSDIISVIGCRIVEEECKLVESVNVLCSIAVTVCDLFVYEKIRIISYNVVTGNSVKGCLGANVSAACGLTVTCKCKISCGDVFSDYTAFSYLHIFLSLLAHIYHNTSSMCYNMALFLFTFS